tara:strand:+ start:235 stop:1164 length:930 start_codon:yes stop_codon:yes gene_type:complete
MSSEAQNLVEEEQDTSVEIDQDDLSEGTSVEVSEESSGSTRTNVRDEESGEELESYSDNVKKRINQLTAKRKQAIEEAEAAYNFAQQKEQENQQLKQKLGQLDQGYIKEYDNRIKSQSAQVKEIYKQAHEAGDSEKMAQAQQIMSKLAVEEERLRVQKGESARTQAQQQQQQQQQVQQPQPQPQRQAQPEDPKLQSWLSKNSWFGPDKVMTRGAQAVHEQLVLEEGFDPSTDEYYSEINKRMKVEFPHKFQEKRTSVQAVTPAPNGRSVKSGRKKSVQLSPGQVAFANKMRIPLETYAKEVAKLENKRS